MEVFGNINVRGKLRGTIRICEQTTIKLDDYIGHYPEISFLLTYALEDELIDQFLNSLVNKLPKTKVQLPSQ